MVQSIQRNRDRERERETHLHTKKKQSTFLRIPNSIEEKNIEILLKRHTAQT